MLPTGTTESSATSIINAYQGRVSLGVVDSSSGGAGRAFSVTYTGLTREACVAIASADWGSQAGSGLIGITVGVSADKTVTPALTQTSSFTMDDMPVTLADAAVACKSTDDNGNGITWTYY